MSPISPSRCPARCLFLVASSFSPRPQKTRNELPRCGSFPSTSSTCWPLSDAGGDALPAAGTPAKQNEEFITNKQIGASTRRHMLPNTKRRFLLLERKKQRTSKNESNPPKKKGLSLLGREGVVAPRHTSAFALRDVARRLAYFLGNTVHTRSLSRRVRVLFRAQRAVRPRWCLSLRMRVGGRDAPEAHPSPFGNKHVTRTLA